MNNFDWSEYLETNKYIPVPEELFSHVENGLCNGIKQGMLLEVCHKQNPDVYWIAEIMLVCGPHLSVKFVGAKNAHWCNISEVKVKPLGWCGKYEESIEPPDDINEAYGDTLIDIMKRALLEGSSVSLEALNNKGLAPIDRIKVGMKVEVRSLFDPYKYWIATIKKNVGGRLNLVYDGSDGDLPDFWLFYFNDRIRHFGYVTNKGSPWQFKYPGKINKFSCPNKFGALLRQSAEESIKEPTPSDLFQCNDVTETHNFTVGMKLEALNPITRKTFHPATVTKVFNNYHFLVVIDDNVDDYEVSKMAYLCNVHNPYVYPVGWAGKNNLNLTPPKTWKENTFDWSKYLLMTDADAAPDRCFADKIASQIKPNMKLEAVNPQKDDEVHVASITSVIDHMLRIELVPTQDKVWYSSTSDAIFPVTWCDSNGYELYVPVISEEVVEEKPKEIKTQEIQPAICPRIHFNYKCYPGPSIIKAKVALLPKHVGPGSFNLVIKEVLNLLISASFTPAKLLSTWEHEGQPEPGKKLEELRAKLKSNTMYAKVQVPTKPEDVSAFCREMCAKLQACPHLFGPVEYREPCPEDCGNADKSKFRVSVSDIVERRGRPKGSVKKRKVQLKTKTQDADSSSKDGDSTGENSSNSSESKQKTEEYEPRTRSKNNRKRAKSDSESDKDNISDVSDGEEPELKKLKFSTADPQPSESLPSIPEFPWNRGTLKGKLPNYPADWSADDVFTYLSETKCKPLARILRKQEVDGFALLLMTQSMIKHFLLLKKELSDLLLEQISLLNKCMKSSKYCSVN